VEEVFKKSWRNSHRVVVGDFFSGFNIPDGNQCAYFGKNTIRLATVVDRFRESIEFEVTMKLNLKWIISGETTRCNTPVALYLENGLATQRMNHFTPRDRSCGKNTGAGDN
jgi:hypothetical protein